jgi:hypothetical protein
MNPNLAFRVVPFSTRSFRRPVLFRPEESASAAGKSRFLAPLGMTVAPPAPRDLTMTVSMTTSSRQFSAYMTEEGPENTLERALPKLECPVTSEGWRHFCEGSECWHAPVPDGAQSAGFVKSMGFNKLDSCLAPLSRPTLAKMRKNTRFQTPTTQNSFLNGINDIPRKVGLGLSCYLLWHQQIGG